MSPPPGPMPKLIPWYLNIDGTPNMRIGYLDIESDGFAANFNIMLSWSLKERGGKVFTDHITKRDLFYGNRDKRITKTLIDCMRHFDIICTYYGTKFDLPFVRTRAIYHGLEFPGYAEIIHFDLCYVVKRVFKLNRSTLDNAARLIRVAENKNHIDWEIWNLAHFGDAKSLEYVMEHNILDVKVLEELHYVLEPLNKWTKRSI
jgi:uncharacterized protein YprB with RNaseH-like and TPR domain